MIGDVGKGSTVGGTGDYMLSSTRYVFGMRREDAVTALSEDEME